jgi:sporulation protein YlmC with PRC-barrel domain
MAIIEDLRQWVGKDVLDNGGEKAGKLADVYFDVETDQPVFLVVDTGKRHDDILVPAWNAATTPDHVTVSYDADVLSGAPTIDLGVGLTLEEEQQLFSFYSVTYEPSQTGSHRRLMRR